WRGAPDRGRRHRHGDQRTAHRAAPLSARLTVISLRCIQRSPSSTEIRLRWILRGGITRLFRPTISAVPVITIGRQFGVGVATVGQMLATGREADVLDSKIMPEVTRRPTAASAEGA